MRAQGSRVSLWPWWLLRGARVLPTCVGMRRRETTLGGTLTWYSSEEQRKLLK